MLVKTLNGHYAYYGITSNVDAIARLCYEVPRVWRKALARRSQQRFSWSKTNRLLERFPLPAPRIVHRYGSDVPRRRQSHAARGAIECDRIEILAYLVTQKLPVFEPSEAFSTACECGRLDAMQLLWERFGTEVWPRRSPTALMHATRGGNPRAVRFLIDLGAEVDDFDLKEDLSPFMHAVSNGRYDAAKALIPSRRCAFPRPSFRLSNPELRIFARSGEGSAVDADCGVMPGAARSPFDAPCGGRRERLSPGSLPSARR